MSKARTDSKNTSGQRATAHIRVQKITIREGNIGIICGRKETADWVRGLRLDTIEELNVGVITDEIVRCSTKIFKPRTPYSIEEFKMKLIHSNPCLVIKKLMFFWNKQFSVSESLIFFGIDKPAFEIIRQMGLKV